MGLSDLIFKRLSQSSEIAALITSYNGEPAIFDTEFPNDEQDGWEGRQYPRISFRIDMQTNQERSAAGLLQVSIYTDKESTVIEIIEKAVKMCLQDVLMNPKDEAPFCVSWMKTESFMLEETEIFCTNIMFDILEYSSQMTTDPDPVLAVASYIKELFPDTLVLGIDRIGEFVQTAERPAFFCRLMNIQKTSGHCEHSVAWMIGKVAVHLIYPDAEKRLQIMSEIGRRMSIDEEIIMIDLSPMTINELLLDNKADYLREGQLIVTGKYGCLRGNEKKHNIVGVGMAFTE